jgi:hypothetical protein
VKRYMLCALLAAVVLLGTTTLVWAAKPTEFDAQGNEKAWGANPGCTTIQSGLITDSAGNPVTVGYDQFGYNYQAHMFNGTYDSSDRVLDGTYWGDTGDYVDDKLMMKWSDEWLSNVDCDEDGKLDRGLVGGDVGGVSLGWLTNHVEGDYVDGSGDVQHFTSFTKVVWTGPGSPLWEQYTAIEDVYNDPAAGYTGLLTKIAAPGFGLNEHWTTTAP